MSEDHPTPVETPEDRARAARLFAGEDPFAIARRWLAEAEAAEINDPTAMALATADADGLPDVRMVLLREIEPPETRADGRGGFVFYTNYQSAKGVTLARNPQAALVLHWKSLRRQIRARGVVEQVEAEKADAYFASRPYQSRIGAWASAQSRPLSSKAALLAEAAKLALRWPMGPPRPPHWGGYRITPSQMEFWSDGPFRMHDRFRWDWTGGGWEVTRLNP